MKLLSPCRPFSQLFRHFVRHFARSRPCNLIKIQEDGGLRRITMADTRTRNSMSVAMMTELNAAINYDTVNTNLRCIVIDAENGPVFSAGHNLKELTKENGIEAQKTVFDKCTELMLSIRKVEVPVIAVVNGLAAAAGCQLVAACDFAIASERSSFSTPGASFGIFCSTPGVPLSRTVNKSMSAYMLMTGSSITAADALNCGLLVKVVHEDQLESEVESIYSKIKSKPRSVLKLGKEYFYQQLNLSYEDALRKGGDVMLKNLQMRDCQEGLTSFKEKRSPVWTHKDE